MTKTEHYDLPQWEPTDRVLREDFNAAMRSIESAIPRIAFGTYVGTGTCRTGIHGSLERRLRPQIYSRTQRARAAAIFGHFGRCFRASGLPSSTNSAYFCTLEWTSTGLQLAQYNGSKMQATS